MCCVCPMSQVVSWSRDAVPSSKEPTRSVTAKLRHWVPRARHGGAAERGSGLGWTVEAMRTQGEGAGRFDQT